MSESSDDRSQGGEGREERTSFTCPRCGGTLQWDGEREKFSCEFAHHDFDASTLVEEHHAAVDRAVNSALRLLAEHERMLRAIADARSARGESDAALRLRRSAEAVRRDAEVLEAAIQRMATIPRSSAD